MWAQVNDWPRRHRWPPLLSYTWPLLGFFCFHFMGRLKYARELYATPGVSTDKWWPVRSQIPPLSKDPFTCQTLLGPPSQPDKPLYLPLNFSMKQKLLLDSLQKRSTTKSNALPKKYKGYNFTHWNEFICPKLVIVTFFPPKITFYS